MTPNSVPKIHTDDLPMSDARDEAWNRMSDCPVVEVEDGYAVTTRDLVESIMKDPSLFSSKAAFDVLGSPVPLVPIAFDPPEQTRYRQILQPFFSPRAVKPLESELRRQIVDIIEPIRRRGSCEFVSEVAAVFPVQVFLTLFGLPLEMRDQLLEWKNSVISLASASAAVTSDDAAAQEGMQKALELFVYLSELVTKRRGQPGDDVLSQLLNLQPPNALTDEEAIGLCFLFVLAGLDTVMDALGLGMQRLADNPSKRQELLDDPTLIPAATEELLRLDPPAPFLPRVTTKEATVEGLLCPAGTKLTSFLAAANRDEAHFAHPNEIDFHRSDNLHISFGLGAHRCLGSHLARLEMNVVLEEWHRRIPHYRISPGCSPQVHWPCGTVGLESLHLTLEGPSD